jgi:hypothetical protein
MEEQTMAGINLEKIKKLEKQRNTIHQDVNTTFTTFEVDGEKYFQIDTYGKINRDMPEKISQSLQFNKKSAQYFINLMAKEFNIK